MGDWQVAPLHKEAGKNEVVLRADQASEYKHILKAIDALNRAGVAHVHLAYEQGR